MVKVALFLDVDNTLTKGFIQQYYAEKLECVDDYIGLEESFQGGIISSQDFGERVINLFNSKNFNRDDARSIFNQIELQPWTVNLLEIEGIDKFFVSSGPSYYNELLGQRFNIPKNHILSSKYIFDADGRKLISCEAVDSSKKSTFVRQKKSEYDYTIGVGDSELHDGPFLASCSIGFITTEAKSHFISPTFHRIEEHIERIKNIKSSQYNAAIDFKSLRPIDLISHMSISSWLMIVGFIVAAFTLGGVVQNFI